MERHGFALTETGVFDPFYAIGAAAMNGGAPQAHVSVGLDSAKEYGTIKCRVSVSLTCPQSEQYLNLAGELAFRKALELTNDAASQIDAPALPAWQEPT